MYYSDEIANNPDMSAQELSALGTKLANWAKENNGDSLSGHDEYSSYGGRAYVIGPTHKKNEAHKADNVANDLCIKLANRIRMTTLKDESKAGFRNYEVHGQSSAADKNTIEISNLPDEEQTPIVYINGHKVSFSAAPPSAIMNER